MRRRMDISNRTRRDIYLTDCRTACMGAERTDFLGRLLMHHTVSRSSVASKVAQEIPSRLLFGTNFPDVAVDVHGDIERKHLTTAILDASVATG